MKTVIEMAREAGFTEGELAFMGDNFLRFADLVRAETLAEHPAQQQEPVGYVAENGVVDWNVCAPPIMTDLYTSPQTAQPSKPWVGLTDEERNRIWSSYRVSFVAIEHIEAKLREKNT